MPGQESKARKRKDALEPDYRIFNLIQVTIQLGRKVLDAQDSLIDNEIAKLRNPEMTCVGASLISKFIETCRLAQDPVGILLQEIWRTLDAIHHQGLEGLDLEALRMNWRRVQVYVSLASDLVVDKVYEELVPIMTEIFEKSL